MADAPARPTCGNCKWFMAPENEGDFGLCDNALVMHMWETSRFNGLLRPSEKDLCGLHAPAKEQEHG